MQKSLTKKENKKEMNRTTAFVVQSLNILNSSSTHSVLRFYLSHSTESHRNQNHKERAFHVNFTNYVLHLSLTTANQAFRSKKGNLKRK